ncbi:MAG: hypothetical protein HC904_07215 [Blastochloris sp.]|nr:hypothetical protein [Blastochloris sp.]
MNLFAGGVVVLQSGDLQELVQNRQQIEVQGVLEKTPEGWYQISVGSSNRLKLLGKGAP